MLKRILIISRAFYPLNSPRSFRATELALEFARQGHEVTVLTPKNRDVHPAFEKQHGLTIKDLGQPKWKSPDFGKSKVGYFMTRAIFRLLSLGFEYPDIELMLLVKKALRKENKYDLLISIAVPYPIHWGVAWARTKKHPVAKTWVADCGDPYMGCKTDSFKKWFYFEYVEKWFMRKVDFVSIPVEGAKESYYKEFRKKIIIIPQGLQIPEVNLPNAPVNNPIPTFAYAGGFIPGIRDPRPFLEFLETVKEDFRFYVFTNQPELIGRNKNILGEKLQIREYIPRDELLRFLTQMDFLVNFDNNTTTCLPSKLIDYAIAGRPVLNVESVINIQAIKQFLMADYSQAMQIGSVDQYRIETVCRQFLELLSR